VGLFFEKMLLLLFLFAYGIGSVMVIGRMLYGKKNINNRHGNVAKNTASAEGEVIMTNAEMNTIKVGQELDLKSAQHAMVDGWIVKRVRYSDKYCDQPKDNPTEENCVYFCYHEGVLKSGNSITKMEMYFYRVMHPATYIVCAKQ